MMGYCCRSSSLSHSGVRGVRQRESGREGPSGGPQLRGGEGTHPNWPSGYESLKNENAVIILIR